MDVIHLYCQRFCHRPITFVSILSCEFLSSHSFFNSTTFKPTYFVLPRFGGGFCCISSSESHKLRVWVLFYVYKQVRFFFYHKLCIGDLVVVDRSFRLGLCCVSATTECASCVHEDQKKKSEVYNNKQTDINFIVNKKPYNLSNIFINRHIMIFNIKFTAAHPTS